jgi:hypothetical protein
VLWWLGFLSKKSKMRSIRQLSTILACLVLASCSLFESLDPKSEQEKTIELLTTGGVWNVDSATWKIQSFAPGLSLTLSDSVFTNYGTWEFQAPIDIYTRFGTGYLIHKYTKKGVAKIDTLAWTPGDFSSTKDDSDLKLTIWFPDSSIPVREIVVDDMENSFDYLQKDNKVVRIKGFFGFSVGAATDVLHTRQYRLTR